MVEISAHFLLVEAVEIMVENDPLAQLPDRLLLELAVELGLAKEHDLEELALLRLEVGHKPERLERVEWHRLALVQAQHDTLALGGELEQRARNRLQEPVLIDPRLDGSRQFLGEGEEQRARLEARIGDVSRYPALFIERAQEFAAQKRLARAHLAGDLDEALAVFERDQQRVQCFLGAAAREEECGVRS